MLNQADSYQGGGNAGEAVKDAEALFRRLKRDVKADYNSKGQVNWRREAREEFDFEAGEQLTEEDKAILQDAKRPIVIFNRVGTTVDSVAGQEVGHARKPIEDRAILGLVRGRSQKLRGEVMNAGDMEKIAKVVAFLTLGMDISNPISVQGQFAFLRNLHYAARHARNVIIASVLGALVSGVVYAFWVGFKASAAAPSAIFAAGGSRPENR